MKFIFYICLFAVMFGMVCPSLISASSTGLVLLGVFLFIMSIVILVLVVTGQNTWKSIIDMCVRLKKNTEEVIKYKDKSFSDSPKPTEVKD